jgi:catechol 2,3-dioxygenase-like lactoylglutathione lyase family enzyme
MLDQVEHLVGLYDQGGITRRQLLQGLVAAGVGAGTMGSQTSVFQTRTINHVTLYVADVARSKAFYQSLTGLPVRDEDPTFCELRLNHGFLGLYARDAGARAGFDHFCFGVERYDPRSALARLKAAVPDADPTLENNDQVYVRDPDGVRVQFADAQYKR